MAKRIKADEIPEFDAARYLDNDAAISAYLTDILAAGDPGLLAAALGTVARARGMTEIAKAAGLTREALYKALRQGSEPRFDTVRRVLTALGLELHVGPQEVKTAAPLHAKASKRARARATSKILSDAA